MKPKLTASFHKPFAEQKAFFENKIKNLQPTASWDDLKKAEHDRAFMVAGALKADLLADLSHAVNKAVSDGETIQQFRKRFKTIVAEKGWHGWTGEETKKGQAWRTKVIYQTNTQTAYNAGRYAQLQQFDIWIYKHNDISKNPRANHKAWHNTALAKNDPFWQTHSPQNGFGCNCFVVGALDNDVAKQMGATNFKAPKDALKINPATGAPFGIGKGWDYQPGASVIDLIASTAVKVNKLPLLLSLSLLQAQQPIIEQAWPEWVSQIKDNKFVQNKSTLLGHLDEQTLQLLKKQSIEPIRADISIEDRLIIGKKSKRHKQQQNQLTDLQWLGLAKMVHNPEAILRDRATGNLLYVATDTANSKVKIVVALDYMSKGKQVTNSVRTVFKVETQALTDATKYEVLKGEIKNLIKENKKDI